MDSPIAGSLLFILLSALVGLGIGSYKRRPVLGLVLGLLLPVIGWVLIALFADGGPKCHACKAPVNASATKCRHCGEGLSFRGTFSADSSRVTSWTASTGALTVDAANHLIVPGPGSYRIEPDASGACVVKPVPRKRKSSEEFAIPVPTTLPKVCLTCHTYVTHPVTGLCFTCGAAMMSRGPA